jgi:nitrate/TMAO reductase-like tetraheme cytochrome c subunit
MRLKNVIKITIGIVFVLLFVSVMQLIIQPAVAAAPQLPNNSCADCHRRLLFSNEEQRQFIDIRIKHLESGISCSIVCHEDKLNKSTASSYALWSISTHALFNVTCEKCHGGNPLASSKTEAHVGLSNNSIERANTPETCGKCHDSQLAEFKSSLHFKKLESGEEGPAPACITCHQAHSVRVLTASEIEDFCSNCHNNITGIDPSVPKRAANALSSVNELQVEFSKARSAIITAKASGQDVAGAEAELDSARTIMKNIPSVWHRFNLTYFDTEVQRGITNTKQAEKVLEENPATPAPQKSPGFEGLMLLAGILAVYLIKRR